MSDSVITSKGQMTVPKAVRDELHLEPGSKVAFIKNREGHYELRPKTVDIKSLKGFMAKIRPVSAVSTLKEIEKSIAEGAVRGAGLNDQP